MRMKVLQPMEGGEFVYISQYALLCSLASCKKKSQAWKKELDDFLLDQLGRCKAYSKNWGMLLMDIFKMWELNTSLGQLDGLTVCIRNDQLWVR